MKQTKQKPTMTKAEIETLVDGLIKKQAQLYGLTYQQSFEKMAKDFPKLIENYHRLTKNGG